MSKNRAPFYGLLSLAVIAAIVLVVTTSRDQEETTSDPPFVPHKSDRDAPADPTTLEALEQALIEAGKIEDPDLRDLKTQEIARAIEEFHGPTPAEREAAVGAAPKRNDPVTADLERTYDLAELRAEFEEALREEDLNLRRYSLGAVAQFLADHDPEVARLWTRELLNSPDGRHGPDAHFFVSIFTENFAKADLGKAAVWAEFLPAETLRPVAHQYIAREWIARDPSAVMAWLNAIEDPAARSNIIRTANGSLLDLTDEAASRWAQELANNEADGPRHSDIVVQHWSRTDLDAAIAWGSGLESPDDVERAVDGLALMMAERDPAGAVEWALQFPEGTVKNKVLALSTTHWAHREPEEAANWLETSGRPEILEMTALSVYQEWFPLDPAAAARWLDNAPLTQEFRSYVRTVVAPKQDE